MLNAANSITKRSVHSSLEEAGYRTYRGQTALQNSMYSNAKSQSASHRVKHIELKKKNKRAKGFPYIFILRAVLSRRVLI